MSRILTICAVLLSMLATAPAMASNGNNGNNSETPRGLLDRPINLPEQAASPVQLAAERRELLIAAREERRALRQLNDNQLRRKARDESDRLAQLVLAERLAEEAQRWASVPEVGNDALSEALQWYAIAAKRGTPGSVSIDKILPAFPVRVLRR